jgi:hypothetical protein
LGKNGFARKRIAGNASSRRWPRREIRGWPGLEQTALDIRYGLRGLARHPVFTATALLTLALTIGAVSTVLTLVHTYFFQQLPVDHPEGIVAISATRRHGSVLGPVSYPDYVHFREQSHTLQGLAAHYSTAPLFVTARDNAKEINGAVVSANFFPLLGIRPAVGRFFTSDEDRVPDRDRVAVLGYDLWRDWFGSSPEAVGGTVHITRVVCRHDVIRSFRDGDGRSVSPTKHACCPTHTA